MRSTGDRIRQAISFEVVGLLISVPLAAVAFGFSLEKTGVLGLIGATLATTWNYIFNLGFDHTLKKLTGSTRKSFKVRILHAFSFELGLLIAFLPIIAWWMGIGLLEALLVDVSFALFYLVYAFVFTWCYDTIFPDPDTAETTQKTSSSPAPEARK
ncbi:PACE efflux transporter [Marinobacter sp. 1_MG-2023]|uniref:PACE efflux transporter n=1 Tax=Marinobacter sp. 1_MG-2023 TaxID=3062627 RepID=UPI0026E1894A|nr:PACE efflux transporter [Marinobacter sp. 1_MG-2023]MDO6825393.1 PACE efflux transporter [Marinobacter sp. 1_MG-2023]